MSEQSVSLILNTNALVKQNFDAKMWFRFIVAVSKYPLSWALKTRKDASCQLEFRMIMMKMRIKFSSVWLAKNTFSASTFHNLRFCNLLVFLVQGTVYLISAAIICLPFFLPSLSTFVLPAYRIWPSFQPHSKSTLNFSLWIYERLQYIMSWLCVSTVSCSGSTFNLASSANEQIDDMMSLYVFPHFFLSWI